MEELDVRFHGICTHFRNTPEGGPPHQRVVLLRCEDTGPDPHRAMLSVPPSTTWETTGGAPDCRCIEQVEISPPDGDLHFRLEGVHLSMPDQIGPLQTSRLWGCGIPRLSEMYPGLGPISDAKARQEPPDGVSAWFDIMAGTPIPYVSLKGAVAVRLLAAFAGPCRIVAGCWQCPGTSWIFTVPSGSLVRVSNDCGVPGGPDDFLVHYRIAENPPEQAPTIAQLPDCTPSAPSFRPDYPPGWTGVNESLGCSNSDYP